MLRLLPFLILSLALSFTPLRAQFWDSLINPEVQITLTHPPALGIQVKRVAFAPVYDQASEDLIAACIADLTATGELEILDRGNIEKIVGEQKFANSGLVDERTAIQLGKMLGSPVMLFIKVNRLETKHIPTQAVRSKGDKDSPRVVVYTSKTQVEFNAAIQAVDLATGKVYAQRRIVESPSREEHSTEGRPEYPADSVVMEMAIDVARTEVRRMLLPWKESRNLIFYDDKAYGMKEAHKLLKLNNPEGALAKSMEALQAAKADSRATTKQLGRTNYNVGICHFIMGNYPAALPFLTAARETDPDHRIFASAKAECEKAIQLVAEMSKVSARSEAPALAGSSKNERPRQSAQPAQPGAGGNHEERLKRLDALRQKGLITAEEYKTKRTEIMNEL